MFSQSRTTLRVTALSNAMNRKSQIRYDSPLHSHLRWSRIGLVNDS